MGSKVFLVQDKPLFNLNDTQTFVGDFVRALSWGDVVFLHGQLGAGKTALVQLLAKEMLIKGPVRSPTYQLVDSYDAFLPKSGAGQLNHFDLYRMSDPLEWFDAGFDELINGHTICVIEWPEKAEAAINACDWLIHIQYASECGPYIEGLSSDFDQRSEVSQSPRDESPFTRLLNCVAVSPQAKKRVHSLQSTSDKC